MPGSDWTRIWLVRLAALALLAAAALILLRLAPHEVPVRNDPGFIDVIFGSRAVVAAVRIVLVFAACYAALSVIVLVWNGRWITSFAGVQTSKIERSVSDLSEDRDRLASELAETRGVLEDVERELDSVLDQLEQQSRELDQAAALIDSLNVDLNRRSRWRRSK